MILSSKGIILKVFPYSDTSLICNVFTDDYGKLTFIAKGVRKAKNPLLSILQPFNLLEFQYYYKKNRSMQLIKEADIVISFDKLRNQLSTIVMGSAILNIINKIFENEYPNTTVFRLIYKTLNKLSSSNSDNKIFFLFYMFHLCQQLGFLPNIRHCHLCNSEFSDKAIFSEQFKSLICINCHKGNTFSSDIHLDNKSLQFLELINKTNIDQISKIEISSIVLQEIYNFLIFFMKHNIHSMHYIKGLKEIEKIYYE